MWQKTLYKSVSEDKLLENLQHELAISKSNNESLNIREIAKVNNNINLVLESKKKVDLDIKIDSLRNIKDIIEKIEELKVKRNYWLNESERVNDTISMDEYCKHKSNRQYQHFNGAINALEYILGVKEI